MSAEAGYLIPAEPHEKLTPACQQNWKFDYANFTAATHVSALHPPTSNGGRRKGRVAFGQLGKDGYKQWFVDVNKVAEAATDALKRGSKADIYVSQNVFGRDRTISQLVSLGAVWCDLDYHDPKKKSKYTGKSPELINAAVLAHLEDSVVPVPSYILSTGRGLCCVWLHDLLRRAALPRWSAVQKHIATILNDFGPDRNALDASRVFRLSGSTNSKVPGSQVKMIWCQGRPKSPTRHLFSTLADEVLPHTQQELRQFKLDRAKAKADAAAEDTGEQKSKPKAPVQRFSAASYYDLVLSELQLIRAYRAPVGPLPNGQRDTWIFLASCAMAYLCPPEEMEREIIALSEEAIGWSAKETSRSISPALKRARLHAEGKHLELGGREVDPRYRFYAKTIVEWLQITPDEMVGAGLRLLVSPDLKRQHAVERRKKSRQKHGSKSREEQQRIRLEIGKKCLWMQTKDGMTIRELAIHFGVATGYVVKAIGEAKRSDGHVHISTRLNK